MTTLTAPVAFAGQSDAELIRDDRRFYAIWLVDLVSHWGTWRHPRRVAPQALSGELCTVARDARMRAEHVGWVIESGEAGYRVVGYEPPERIYLVCPGRRPGVEIEVADPRQLTLAECVGVE